MFNPELFEKLKRRLMEFFREPGGQRGLTDLKEGGQRFDADLLPEVPNQIFPNLVIAFRQFLIRPPCIHRLS